MSPFEVICGGCFELISRGTGYALSCTCFVCDRCGKGLKNGSRIQQCSFCEARNPAVASLLSDECPAEIRTLLGNVSEEITGILAMFDFQTAHYRKIIEHSTREVKKLKRCEKRQK